MVEPDLDEGEWGVYAPTLPWARARLTGRGFRPRKEPEDGAGLCLILVGGEFDEPAGLQHGRVVS